MPMKPKTLTPAQLAEVETLASVLNAGQMADYFGIGRTTLFAMLDRDEDVAERYKRGKARAIGAIAQSLIAKARGGDTACMIFFLKTQAGWRETAAIEHFAPDSVGEFLKSISDHGLRIGSRPSTLDLAPSGRARIGAGPEHPPPASPAPETA